jgi:hypothetical protein
MLSRQTLISEIYVSNTPPYLVRASNLRTDDVVCAIIFKKGTSMLDSTSERPCVETREAIERMLENDATRELPLRPSIVPTPSETRLPCEAATELEGLLSTFLAVLSKSRGEGDSSAGAVETGAQGPGSATDCLSSTAVDPRVFMPLLVELRKRHGDGSPVEHLLLAHPLVFGKVTDRLSE